MVELHAADGERTATLRAWTILCRIEKLADLPFVLMQRPAAVVSREMIERRTHCLHAAKVPPQLRKALLLGMYFLGDGRSVTLQQTLSGTGIANATPVGYARALYNSGGVQIRFRSRRFGSAGNNWKIALVDIGASIVVPSTSVSLLPDGVTTQVVLRRNAGGIQATAQEVCDAINNYRPNAPLPIVADVVVAGTVPAALAATNLSGGVEPASNGNLYRFVPAANISGGLFFFEQGKTWEIQSIEGAFDGAATPLSVEVRVCNVTEGLDLRSSESVVVFATSLTTAPLHFSITDVKMPLQPGQALAVYVNAQGLIRCTARPQSPWS